MRSRSQLSRSFADLSSAEILDRVARKTLIWPIGSVEQHGPHLPLSVDMVIPEALAQQLAFELDGYRLPVQAVAARSLPQSGGGLAFPGTVYINGDTLVRYLRETIRSLAGLSFNRLVLLNGHFENEAAIFDALDWVRERALLTCREMLAFSWWSMVSDDWLASELEQFPGWHAEHAGLTETSLMLYLRPDLVSDERPDHHAPPRAGVYLHPIDVSETTNRGVLSRCSDSSAELGERLFWHIIDQTVSFLDNGHGILK